jgi:hypothetical protein
VIPRTLLLIFLAAFTVLIVSFAVLMGGYGIPAAMGDPRGASVLGWAALACGLLLGVDTILLMVAMAWCLLEQTDEEPLGRRRTTKNVRHDDRAD